MFSVVEKQVKHSENKVKNYESKAFVSRVPASRRSAGLRTVR